MKLINKAPPAYCESPLLILVTKISLVGFFHKRWLLPAPQFRTAGTELVCALARALRRATVTACDTSRGSCPASRPSTAGLGLTCSAFGWFWSLSILFETPKLSSAVLRKAGSWQKLCFCGRTEGMRSWILHNNWCLIYFLCFLSGLFFLYTCTKR